MVVNQLNKTENLTQAHQSTTNTPISLRGNHIFWTYYTEGKEKTHSENGYNFWEGRQRETTGKDFGWSGKLSGGGEIKYGNDK
jgi:hypothetical protein